MKTIDIVILIIIFSVGLTGSKNGFFKQTVILVGTLLCFLFAWYFKNPIANFLSYNLPFFNFKGRVEGLTALNIVMYQLIAFIILLAFFIAVLIVLIKITNIFEKILKFTIVLGIPSKILGFLVGLIEGYVIVFCAILFLKQPAFNLKILNESTVAEVIVTSSPVLSNVISKTNESIRDIYEIIKTYNQNDKSKTNKEIIEVLLNYKIIDNNYLNKLIDKGKIKI